MEKPNEEQRAEIRMHMRFLLTRKPPVYVASVLADVRADPAGSLDPHPGRTHAQVIAGLD